MQCQYCGAYVQSDFCLKCGALAKVPTAPLTSQPSLWSKFDKPTKIFIATIGGLFGLAFIAALVIAAFTPKRAVQSEPVRPLVTKADSSTAVPPTPSDHLSKAKEWLANNRGLGSLREARSELMLIFPSDKEYVEAQKLLKTIEPEIAKKEKQESDAEIARDAAEAPALRESLASNYINIVSTANPHLNFIKKKLTKMKGGYALWAVHEYFSQYSFSIGDDAKIVQMWIAQNGADLHKAQIVRVGFMGSSGYSGYCYFDLK